MAYAVSRANQQDIGKRLETAVFGEFQRRLAGSRIEAVTSHTAPTSKREKVNFLVGDVLVTEPYALFQVTVGLESEKTRRRELGSLEVAMHTSGRTEGTVITLREEGEVECEAGHIRIVPAWKWTLEG